MNSVKKSNLVRDFFSWCIKENNLTLKQVCEITGCQKTRLCRYMRGAGEPSITEEQIITLLNRYGFDIDVRIKPLDKYVKSNGNTDKKNY